MRMARATPARSIGVSAAEANVRQAYLMRHQLHIGIVALCSVLGPTAARGQEWTFWVRADTAVRRQVTPLPIRVSVRQTLPDTVLTSAKVRSGLAEQLTGLGYVVFEPPEQAFSLSRTPPPPSIEHIEVNLHLIAPGAHSVTVFIWCKAPGSSAGAGSVRRRKLGWPKFPEGSPETHDHASVPQLPRFDETIDCLL